MKPDAAGAASAAGFDPSSLPGVGNLAAMLGPSFMIFALIGLVILIFTIFCWWKIFSKAGYSGALSLVFLLGIIPLIGPLICLVFFIWFAFAQWPVTKGGGGAPMKT